jgi:hypothetical protein
MTWQEIIRPKKKGVSDCMVFKIRVGCLVRKKQTSLCDFRGRSILVGLKKKKIPYQPATDPNFEDHAIGNTLFFWPNDFLPCHFLSFSDYPVKLQ